MPSPSLPNECFINILSFLNKNSLYNCLFVNRYYCKFSIPIIWRDPFIGQTPISPINTLLACLNEDEISSLIPYAINFINNNQFPLFEYGKFVKKVNHCYCVEQIGNILSVRKIDQDYRVKKLVNAVYHLIMRESSNLQELVWKSYDLPKFFIFTTYKPGITNLKSLIIDINYFDEIDNERYQNTIEFLNMVPKSCNGITDCELFIPGLNSTVARLFMDIIKLQPLERILMHMCMNDRIEGEDINVLHTLEFRSDTLKELSFQNLDFEDVDLSFLSKLDRLERLEFYDCKNFASQYNETLFKKRFYLEKLYLLYDDDDDFYDKFDTFNYFGGVNLNVMEKND